MTEPGTQPVLDVADVAVSYGGVRAVAGVSFQIPRGRIHGLIGPNGSGKSTLLNALTGLVSARGSAAVNGVPLRFGNPRAIRELGVLRAFQTAQTFGELTCLENVALADPDRSLTGLWGSWGRRRAMLRREHVRWTNAATQLDRVGLADSWDMQASLLPYGRQRLLELARCLAGDPTLLLLDEPSAGLNATETEELAVLLDAVRHDGVTILLVDHKVDFIDRLSDRIVVLELGAVIADGPPDAVWSDPAVVDAYLGRQSGG